MEIAVASENSIKIKGKNVTVISDPTSKSGPADIVFTLRKSSPLQRVDEARLLISGPGEYEVGGVKLTGISAGDHLVFTGEIDGVRFVAGDAKGIEEILSKLDETQVAVIKVSEGFNSQIITGLGPNVSLIYGPKRDDALNELGKKDLAPVAKYSVKNDALTPEKEEIVALG